MSPCIYNQSNRIAQKKTAFKTNLLTCNLYLAAWIFFLDVKI